MGKRTLDLSNELYEYLLINSLREPAVVQELREETNRMLMSAMQTPPEQGQFLAMIVELMNAKQILEVGTFTGYGALWMALSLPEGGQITSLDVDEKWCKMARNYWRQAGVEDKIDLIIAPASESMRQLLNEQKANFYDIIFIDADKEGYLDYYELAMKLVRVGGLILLDNVLWGGSVINEFNQGRDVCAIREVNKRVHLDDRVTMSLMPIGDGLTFAIRRK
ncbi:O-methyltransferase [Saccharibacillus brassicae]|uniref:SAM-dependent methyltransferase n=1 Tax=Saccharibacillus brassicae TaxID=2583377 RepID=A0A4Y6UTZ5_SACBS|nr:class I SAM-dependent methyltransferase [Saccharibacillus brassicae]QDH19807.1 SAM-dependent methyltransferase [Saccharibacillus brassicae]